ncbi:hypothetical protein D9619_013013 [Psilocybe cf. subviscida]|uniref:Transcription factor TFIIIC triple barrel domain-containing protein n=1 Tax=Psilocybe cf. subviscida TaxID=2480587 RepID=A0A8H5AZB9_9AGAR|nr:hypothetical protein D9619_013013 [Psilocybe cf. subviscida]
MSAAPTYLCPGYKEVEEFGPDEEYEEEEVFYVTLDMGNVEPTLVPTSSSYRLIGLDTPTPFIQLQGTILKGRHDMLLGTELIFTDDKETHDWNKRSVVHVGNTEHRIAFREVTLVPKGSGSAKGKERANPDTETVSAHAQSLAATPIDRMTGLSAPVSRAPRKGKGASASVAPKATASTSGNTANADTPSAPRRSSRRASRVPEAAPPPMQIEGSSPPRPHIDDEDDDSDDMYVDD